MLSDFPLQRFPTISNWSENFALGGYDPRCDVDIFLHLGRWRRDLSLWREMVAIGLPNSTVLAYRGISNTLESSDGPGGGCLQLRVERSERRLHYRYLGAVRRIKAEELSCGYLRDGPCERLELDMLFDSDYSIWDLSYGRGSADDAVGRIEQLGRMTGALKVGREVFDFNTIVNRTHSRGVREAATIARHSWMHGTFENGVSFQCYEGETPGPDVSTHSDACVFAGGIFYRAKLNLKFRLQVNCHDEDLQRRVPFSIEYEKGTLNVEALTFPHLTEGQFSGPWDSYLGARRQIAGRQARRFINQSMRLEMNDGIAGYGHMERTVPGSLIVEPT